MKDGLYHAELGLPPVNFTTFATTLCYSNHARQAALHDRYGVPASVPKHHQFAPAEIFEVEVAAGKVVKFCARLKNAGKTTAGKTFDLVLACSAPEPHTAAVFVRTLWLNEPGDNHSTLDKSKYIPYAS